MSEIITPRGRLKTVSAPAPHDVELLQVAAVEGGQAVGTSYSTVPMTNIAENTRPNYFTVSAAGEITNNGRLTRATVDYAVSVGSTDGAAWSCEVILELDGVELPGSRRWLHGGQ